MKMIQTTNSKKRHLSEMVEELLHIGGKIMSCVEQMDDEPSYGNMGYQTRMSKEPSRYDEYHEERSEMSPYTNDMRGYRR